MLSSPTLQEVRRVDDCQRLEYNSEVMSAGKADVLYTLLVRLLDNRPIYDNFIKTRCFTVTSRQYKGMVLVLAELGYRRHSLKNFVMEVREIGGAFSLPGVVGVVGRMRSVEDR